MGRTRPVTRFGWPEDTASVVALLLAVLSLLAWRARRQLPSPPFSPRAFVALLGVASALLSAGYVYEYLRGGPRIIDATSYFLQARIFANGQLGFVPPEPEASHFGRFLVSMPDGRLSTLFPPGYPAWLALGFWLRAPMWMGPLTAAALTLATYWLAQRCFADTRLSLLAAAMSTLCAVLRYHTADTMAHGFAALLLTLCLACTISGDRRTLPIGGFLLGWLFATRPVTAMVTLAVQGWVLSRRARSGPRLLPLFWLAPASIGVGLWLWQQQAVTGEWFSSSQYRYYELADAPAECFRYGFGNDVGCRGEHGDFIAAYQPDGYGPWQALGTTLRRLAAHLADAGNQELFAAGLLLAPVLGQKDQHVRWLSGAIGLQVLAYAGFYFDGNYPGGGARMFADVLPLEHVLLAWLCRRLSLTGAALPTMLLGFSLHTSFDHRKLAGREGGAPMYDAAWVNDRVEPDALVFVYTDHGYALSFDPSGAGVQIARGKGDALDFASFIHAGEPPTYSYRFDPGAVQAKPELVPFRPVPSGRFEAENQWPLRSGRLQGVRRGPGPNDLGDGLWLGPGVAELSLWTPAPGAYLLTLRALGSFDASIEDRLVIRAASTGSAAEWTGAFQVSRGGSSRMRLRVEEGAFVDWFEIDARP